MTTLEYLLAALLICNAFTISLSGHVRRIHDVERKLNLVLAHLGIDQASQIAPTSHVLSLAIDPDRRIEAIKAYRTQTGAGLKEAVAVIDKIATGAKVPRA